MSTIAQETSVRRASVERSSEIAANLSEIRQRMSYSSPEDRSVDSSAGKPLLVAVSKYKPSSDVLACYEQGQRDFGENYVQEMVDKAEQVRTLTSQTGVRNYDSCTL